MKQTVEVEVTGTTTNYYVVRGNSKISHNPNGPARIYVGGFYGRKVWMNNGKVHRTDGPAIEWDDGDIDYFHCGKRHRLDGPAIIRQRAVYRHRLGWYINGTEYSTESAFLKAVTKWLSYKEVTREDIEQQIGQFRIVEWE